MGFQKKLSGDFVVLAEFDTPKGVDVSDLFSNIITKGIRRFNLK